MGWWKIVHDRSGQMAVEAALMVPVMIVAAFVVANLMDFNRACMMFDQVAQEAIVAHGVSPEGHVDTASASREVRSAIEEALDSERYEVSVEAVGVGRLGSAASTFDILPRMTRYDCKLTYHPWPSSFSIAGASFSPPSILLHTKSLVVDRYRPGVVV